MRHTIEELRAIAYEYFPRGIPWGDARYAESPEVQRQKAARIPASAKYDAWRAMLDRLRARFPEDRFPGVQIENGCLFLQAANATNDDRGFTGRIWLPPRGPHETSHHLEFVVSFVVPYFAIRSTHAEPDPTPELPPAERPRLVFQGDTCYVLPPDPNAVDDTEGPTFPRTRLVWSFELSPDERPFAEAIAEEVRATFAGHEPFDSTIGETVVPDVQAGNKLFGEATLFTCLFSDGW